MPACIIGFNSKKVQVTSVTGNITSAAFSSDTCRETSWNSWFRGDALLLKGVVINELEFHLDDFAVPWQVCFEESDQPLVDCNAETWEKFPSRDDYY